MISFVGVNKAFGGQVLFDDLNLSVNRGERVGLVGRNGHGKSTLFQMIIGNVEPDSGLIQRGASVTRMLKERVVMDFWASMALMVKLKVLAALGVPFNIPEEESVVPVGSVPPVTA